MRILLVLLILISGCIAKGNITRQELLAKYSWPDIVNTKISIVDIIDKNKILENLGFIKIFWY